MVQTAGQNAALFMVKVKLTKHHFTGRLLALSEYELHLWRPISSIGVQGEETLINAAETATLCRGIPCVAHLDGVRVLMP